MFLPLSTLIFFLVFMECKTDKEFVSFMRLTPPLDSIDCRDTSNETMEVNIQSRSQLLRVSDLLNGSVKIDFERIPNDHVLLTFTNDQSNENAEINDIGCWSTVSDSIIVSDLVENETQMFCLMEKESKTVSPLDCLSILPRNSASDSVPDAVWLTEDDKTLFVGLLVMGLIICLILGFVIGMWIVKRQATATNCRKVSSFSRPDLISSDWRHDNRSDDNGYPYTDNDTISVASDRSSYVAAVNPSRFDLIKMRLEKAENPTPSQSQNLYDLEDMPTLKAPTPPGGFRDSGISTSGPIYAISSKIMERTDQSDNNDDNLYLCVNHEIESDVKKNE